MTFRTKPSPYKKDDAIFITCPCGNLTVCASTHEQNIILEDRGTDQTISFPYEATEAVVRIIRSLATDLAAKHAIQQLTEGKRNET